MQRGCTVYDFDTSQTCLALSKKFQNSANNYYSKGGAIWVRQVHGTGIAKWTPHSSPRFDCEQPADGITVDARDLNDVTAAPTPIVVTADCVPILWVSTDAPVWGVLHASRKNIEDGLLAVYAQQMQTLNLEFSQVLAIIGPAICGKCYEVGTELGQKWRQIDPLALRTSKNDLPALDLPDHVGRWLQHRGATTVRFGECTLEEDRWFSYRRNGTGQRIKSWIRKI